MTCQGHLVAAARYAALALSAERPTPETIRTIGPLRDDVADNLGALVATLSGRGPITAGRDTLAALVRDPVGSLAAHLESMPRLAPDWEHRPSPFARYAGWPRHPWEATTLTRSWQGLGAETLFASHAAPKELHGMSDAARWSALHDVAVLAQAYAALDADLTSSAPSAPAKALTATPRAEDVLALRARELAVLADASGPPRDDHSTDRRPRSSVVPVSRLAALPLAITRLQLLLNEAGPMATATDLIAATLALTLASSAAARALDSGADAHGSLSQQLRTTAEVLRTYSRQVHSAAMDATPRLASIHRSTPGIHQQASEIGGEATRRILDLVPRPQAADAASPHLLEFASRVGPATRALHSALDAAHHSGRLYERDRSPNPTRGWAPTRDLGPPALADALVVATHTATAVPAPPATWTPSPFTSRPAAVTDLVGVLQRRQEFHRPSWPGAPRWGGPPPHTR